MAASRQFLSGLFKSQGLFGKTFLERLFAADATSLLRHDAAPFLFEEGGSATERSHHRYKPRADGG